MKGAFMVKIGDQAPEFSATTQDGEELKLSDFAGKKNVVLYFYPKDYTSGCTKEACGFRDEYEAFTELDTVVLGVSGDSEKSHRGFIEKHSLNFTLLADSDGSLRSLYGSTDEMGELPKRVTFIIDRDGILRHAFVMKKAEDHVPEALRLARALSSQ